MNKRQKKKLYKKLHGYNPPKDVYIHITCERINPPEEIFMRFEYEKPVTEEVPPHIKTAKILTAQRAAGKRRKRNYSKRRK